MNKIVPFQSPKLQKYRDSVGLDIFGILFNDASLRPQIIDGHVYLSLVSLLELLGESKTNRPPRLMWGDLKSRIKRKSPELYAEIVQLKMRAKDNKHYLSDAAELQIVLKIIRRLNTPASLEFSDLMSERVAGIVEAMLNYRLLNIMQGMEWAADSTHEDLKGLEPPDDLTAWEDIGYS